MSWIAVLDELENLPKASGFIAARELLDKYENCFLRLMSQHSVFELTMNLKFEDGNFFNAFEICGATVLDPKGFLDYWAPGRFPRCLVIYTFRCFFENGNGNNFYKPASDKYKLAIGVDGNTASSAPVDFSKALRKVWGVVFKGDNVRNFDQEKGVPRELFCSRCWLIKNFQKREGNSNLCFAVRAYKDIKDKELRLRPECYPKKSNGTDSCENHLKRLLTAPGCEFEREYLSDFVDNGASDDVRFAWFTQLDKKSRAIISNLVDVVEHNGVLSLVVDREHDFPCANVSADRIKVKLVLKSKRIKDQSQTYWFKKNKSGKWMCEGVSGDTAPQPIWKVVGMTKIEYAASTGQECSHEDILRELLADCNLSNGYGSFLVNEDRGRKSIYVPFSNRRLPVGRYSVYAYRYVSGTDFRVVYDKSEVLVNGRQPEGRSFTVTHETDDVTVCVHGNIFKFGVNKRSPIREAHNREQLIEHKDPSHIFLSVQKWPLPSVDDGSWSYDIDGISVHTIKTEHLYKTGRLTFSCNDVIYEEPKVTFVDFVTEEVFEKFPALGVGESRIVKLDGCGALDGIYDIDNEQVTCQKTLPGGHWRLNIPIIREGVTFRAEDGAIVLSCPFVEANQMGTKYLALEDFQKSLCVSCCAPGYDHVEITSVKYCNGNEYSTHIPLLKGRAGFVFSNSRAYLTGRSGVNGDVRVRDLLSDQQKIESFVIEEIPSAGSTAVPKRCQVQLYDPKLLPVDANDRSVINGRVSITIYVSYYSHIEEKVMRWLPSDGLDAPDGVKTFDSWTAREYYQEQCSGRWKLHLKATAMHANIDSVFSRGAVLLAFIAERSCGGFSLISGGFCLYDERNSGLRIAGGDWGSRLRMAMHKRYNKNVDDLEEMLGIYTLRRYSNDFDTLNSLRRGLRERLDSLRSNVKALGRGADLYMNSFFNVRDDQWSGYAYLAGWYFAECVAKEIEADDDKLLEPEDCMCFYSSTGRRIWHPLMISRRAIVMADRNNVIEIWRQYYTALFEECSGEARLQEVVDKLIDCLEKCEWYFSDIADALKDVSIQLKSATEIGEAVNEFVKMILQWRTLSEFQHADDVACGKQDAELLLALTQKLRNTLLALEDIDERMRSTANVHAEDVLFCDLLKRIDASNWVSGPCRI